MSKLFYQKMAITNLKNNTKIYLPYLLTCICTIAAYYILYSIAVNSGLDKLPGSDAMKMILSFGTVVIGIFSFIFLFYTNSFLIKRRKKEIGLYHILGMEKKHTSFVIFYETLFTYIISIVLGLITGLVFSKLLFLLFLNILNTNVPLSFSISAIVIRNTILLFSGIFLIILISNLIQIRRSSPIALLKSQNYGEKELKSRWILTIIGVIFLGTGYIVANVIDSPLAAITIFFFDVIAVIIGTYLLFLAGSIALLKILQKNKLFYYKPKNFITLSSMIYRMKQNAAGLANICILSTMVLVTLSTTICLYVGQKDLLSSIYPREVTINYEGSLDENNEVQDLLKSAATKNEISLSDEVNFPYTELLATQSKSKFTALKGKDYDLSEVNNLTMFTVMTLDDFNKYTDTSKTLKDNELLIYSNFDYHYKSFSFGSMDFQVKEKLDDFFLPTGYNVSNNMVLIVKDSSLFSKLYKENSGEEYTATQYMTYLNTKGTTKNLTTFYNYVDEKLPTLVTDSNPLDIRSVTEDNFSSIYSGFLFIGMFLGTLFLMATILIIYYKQISEGYDDYERYHIMKKVGLSVNEIKSTIKQQIVMVFFLPLAAAVIHICFAFHLISRLLLVFGLSNTWLFFLCCLACVGIFAICYGIIFLITARSYYKIVNT